MSLEPATRMSLTCISGTATTLRTLLSVANTFFDQLLSRELSKRFPGVEVPVFSLSHSTVIGCSYGAALRPELEREMQTHVEVVEEAQFGFGTAATDTPR